MQPAHDAAASHRATTDKYLSHDIVPSASIIGKFNADIEQHPLSLVSHLDRGHTLDWVYVNAVGGKSGGQQAGPKMLPVWRDKDGEPIDPPNPKQARGVSMRYPIGCLKGNWAGADSVLRYDPKVDEISQKLSLEAPEDPAARRDYDRAHAELRLFGRDRRAEFLADHDDFLPSKLTSARMPERAERLAEILKAMDDFEKDSEGTCSVYPFQCFAPKHKILKRHAAGSEDIPSDQLDALELYDPAGRIKAMIHAAPGPYSVNLLDVLLMTKTRLKLGADQYDRLTPGALLSFTVFIGGCIKSSKSGSNSVQSYLSTAYLVANGPPPNAAPAAPDLFAEMMAGGKRPCSAGDAGPPRKAVKQEHAV